MTGSHYQTHPSSDFTTSKLLSKRSTDALKLLAAGYAHDEIMLINPAITRSDISLAAEEALALHAAALDREERAERIVRTYPRAFEKWSTEEEERAAQLYNAGKTMREIAAVIERQPNAIKIRLQRIGLFRPDDRI